MHIYLVGGAVRDQLLGLKAYDKDYVVTGARPEDLLAQGFSQVGKDFPVFLHPLTHEEYALARTERKAGSGYTGFICAFGPEVSLEEDLKRRDLTVNAMARDEEGNLIDPYGGLADLKARILRHVSPAFVEDPLRVLRAARFVAKLAPFNFTLHPTTAQLLRDMAASGELNALTPERCFMEVHKAMSTAAPERFFSTLHQCQALPAVMPEMAALFVSPSSLNPDLSAFERGAQALALIKDKVSDPALRFATLAHDLGAPDLQTLSSRMHLPKDYQEAVRLVHLSLPLWQHLPQATATDILALFTRLDLYRRPQRLEQMVPILGALSATLGQDTQTRAQALQQIFGLTQEVQVQALVQQGLKGKAIGEAVARLRLGMISDFCAAQPDALL